MPKYGFFNSALSAVDAVTAGLEYGQLQACEQGLYWIEFRPLEGGRNVLVRRSWQGEIACLTPPGFNVRSGVYEYGGKSWCKLPSQIAFVNATDQQIWLLNDEAPNQSQSELLSETFTGLQPQQLTHRPDCRYGDLLFDVVHLRIIAVQEQATEDPTQPRHALVSISIETGKVTELASGDDFYAAPTLSADGHLCAWISWDHPHMPWVSTRLNRARINTGGELADRQVVAGDSSPEAIQQPRFISDNSLVAVSDKTGWWNLYRYLYGDQVPGEQGVNHSSESGLSEQSVRTEPLWPRENDFGIPQWQMCVYTWDELSRVQPAGGQSADDQPATWVASYMERGEGRLVIGSKSMQEQRIAKEYSLFRHVCGFNEKVYCIAASKDSTAAIIEIMPDSATEDAIQVIVGGQSPRINVNLPQPVTYPVGDESAYGFLYQPQPLAQPESAERGSKPPLLVFTHGGPTGATYPVYNPKIQFWVSRGFAVVDLNYRGSTGYGRDYRLRLAGSWGEADWQDAVAAVDYLANQGLIDPDNVFIRGGSAGGYTTLCALAFSDRFKGGASYYGVSDPVALTRDTHKFESHYLDWLIGDPEKEAELYRQRSPLECADQVRCPMIFFQGGKDRVVVPQQTEVMVNALKGQGIPVEYHLYPDEQHGFRQAENQIHSLEAELAFYRGLLS